MDVSLKDIVSVLENCRRFLLLPFNFYNCLMDRFRDRCCLVVNRVIRLKIVSIELHVRDGNSVIAKVFKNASD